MKQADFNLLFQTGLLCFFLNGCVPAGQTIATLDQQTLVAKKEYGSERTKTGQLYQQQRSLQSQLAVLKAKRNSLETADPIANRSEIASLNRQVAALERQLNNRIQ